MEVAFSRNRLIHRDESGVLCLGRGSVLK